MVNNNNKGPLLYRIFKSYIRFWHDKVYYKETYSVNPENIPANGTPLMIVSNHQNCLNDPLGVLFTFRKRKINFITRADVFALHPIANKFLRAIGLLPAYRLNYEGLEALKNNGDTIRLSKEVLLSGATLMLFPEAGHQNKRWLGTFSFGYTRLAFETAEMGNFEKDIQILPSCNHYSNYFGLRNKFLVKFGTPISLQPYYELYKTKPRTAQREVNKLVRAQIKSLMLNIEDLDNYTSIDFLRNAFGKEYAASKGYNPAYLPDMLVSDKALVAGLAEAKEADEAAIQQLYDEAASFEKDLKAAGIKEYDLTDKTCGFTLLLQMLVQLALLPVWIFSLWPSILMYYIPRYFSNKTNDPMFEGTFLYAFSVLFTFPIFGILTLLLEGFKIGWLYGAIHVVLIPFLCIFAWNYAKWVRYTCRMFKTRFMLGHSRTDALRARRESIREKIFKVLNK